MTNKSSGKHSILIVEDHPLVRLGLADIIENEPDFQLLAAVESAGEALELVREQTPSLAVVDISLSDSSGLSLVKDICAFQRTQSGKRTRILVLSAHDEALFAPRSIEAGATGYISKEEDLSEILRAMRTVLEGELYVSDRLKEKVSAFSGGAADITTINPGCLSDRELEVFRLIGQGFSTSAIAGRLELSVKTIESHQANIKRKLCLASSTELVRCAVQWDFEQK